MSFAAEPPYRHGQPERTAVLLCNLGTPDAPTPAAVRRYLAEFLGDRRVVEIPRLLWLLLLHGIILRTRPAQSARRYAGIWTADGSPLKFWTERQAALLADRLGAMHGSPMPVRPAMRYGSPSIASALDALKAEGATRVLVLPLYPQYSSSTTATAFDAIAAWARGVRRIPEFRFVNQYHDDAAYLDALAASVRAHWATHGRGQTLVMSFHGVPKRTLLLGDPYHCDCRKTARLLAARLGLGADEWLVTFQSRLGRAEWLQPYTEPTLIELARRGVARVDLICPGFPADCLETLEEIDQEARAAFLAAGGKSFHYIPCLNDSPAWLDALATIAARHLRGWPAEAPTEALELQRREAARLGAPA